MHWKRPRVGRPTWSLCLLASLWILCGATGAAAQSAPRAQGVSTVETYQGTPVGFTAEGHPFRGNPDAPLTMVEYIDFLCPFCGRYFQETLPVLMDKYVRTGQVKFVVRDLPLAPLHPTAPRGHVAASCVGEQGATRFWQMHDALFQGQPQWNALPDPTAFLANVARKVGADIAVYERCMTSGRSEARVQQSVAAGQTLGFAGTPTFQFVDKQSGKTHTLMGAQPVSVFTEWIDALLAGKEPPQAQPPEKPVLPFWAKPEGLAPDPKRPGFTVAGDPYKGNPSAKLVVVEFTDFQCPACQRHALTTQPDLDKRFIETGEVLWVAKHSPLRIHPYAPVAAAAAECAGDQGKFWAMHHQLFAQMAPLSTADDPDRILVGLAADLELDGTQFAACLTGRKALERVLRGLYDAQAIGVRGTPTFILLYGGTGHALAGARSAEQFAATLQEHLDRAKAESTVGRPSE